MFVHGATVRWLTSAPQAIFLKRPWSARPEDEVQTHNLHFVEMSFEGAFKVRTRTELAVLLV